MTDILFINGKFLSSPVTGVQRYAIELFRMMDVLLQQPEYQAVKVVCLAPRDVSSVPDWQRIEFRRVGVNTGNLWEQLDLPWYAKGGLLFSPANSGPLFYFKQVITFHDANIFAIPEAYSVLFRVKYHIYFNVLARIARKVLTDSVFSQKELAHYLGLPRERFIVHLLGGDHLDRVFADDSILQRQGLVKGGYLLCVASQSRHKNFGSVLQAAGRIGKDIHLVAAGGSNAKIFQTLGLDVVGSQVSLLGYVSDSELKALYENAQGFVFPSLYEGFGLPILEAMRCGCPVLCSSAASIPEVGGQAVIYFDPIDIKAMVMAIQTFLGNSEMKMDLRTRGYAQSAGFRWEDTARETLTDLVECLKEGQR